MKTTCTPIHCCVLLLQDHKDTLLRSSMPSSETFGLHETSYITMIKESRHIFNPGGLKSLVRQGVTTDPTPTEIHSQRPKFLMKTFEND